MCSHCGWDQDYESLETPDDVEAFDLDGGIVENSGVYEIEETEDQTDDD